MSCDYYSNAVFGQSDQMLPNALSEHRIDADRRLVPAPGVAACGPEPRPARRVASDRRSIYLNLNAITNHLIWKYKTL